MLAGTPELMTMMSRCFSDAACTSTWSQRVFPVKRVSGSSEQGISRGLIHCQK